MAELSIHQESAFAVLQSMPQRVMTKGLIGAAPAAISQF